MSCVQIGCREELTQSPKPAGRAGPELCGRFPTIMSGKKLPCTGNVHTEKVDHTHNAHTLNWLLTVITVHSTLGSWTHGPSFSSSVLRELRPKYNHQPSSRGDFLFIFYQALAVASHDHSMSGAFYRAPVVPGQASCFRLWWCLDLGASHARFEGAWTRS